VLVVEQTVGVVAVVAVVLFLVEHFQLVQE
jgi:hypothetical protein